jgi:hypothetical protein
VEYNVDGNLLAPFSSSCVKNENPLPNIVDVDDDEVRGVTGSSDKVIRKRKTEKCVS